MDNIDAASIGVIASNPIYRGSMGFSWETLDGNQFHMAFEHYFKSTYSGPSAIFPGATESTQAYLNVFSIGWSARY